MFWEESRFRLAQPLEGGDHLELRKHQGDGAGFYRIDLIELEAPPPALPQPADSISVTDFGAVPDDGEDDSDAILACLAVAKAQQKSVWIPGGVYHQSQRFIVEGPLVVRGAGMWHTEILGTSLGTDFAGNMGFELGGDGAEVSDLYLDCVAQTRRQGSNGKGFTLSGGASNRVVENVWITHTQTGFWMSTGAHGLIRNCRMRFTYADGININRGTSHTVIEHCHVRGCGDDGIVTLSETERSDPPAVNNTLRNNTVSAIWWGQNLVLGGGSEHLVENNLLPGNALMAVFAINMTGAYPKHPTSDCIVRGNTLVHGGGNFVGQNRGAAWINASSTTVTDIVFEDNNIVSPLFSGIHIRGNSTQKIIFRNNRITDPGGSGSGSSRRRKVGGNSKRTSSRVCRQGRSPSQGCGVNG